MTNIAYGIPGIDEQAGDLIQKRLCKLPGVHDVTVWLGEQQVDVSYDPAMTSPAALADTLRQLGYLPKLIPWQERTPG